MNNNKTVQLQNWRFGLVKRTKSIACNADGAEAAFVVLVASSPSGLF